MWSPNDLREASQFGYVGSELIALTRAARLLLLGFLASSAVGCGGAPTPPPLSSVEQRKVNEDGFRKNALDRAASSCAVTRRNSAFKPSTTTQDREHKWVSSAATAVPFTCSSKSGCSKLRGSRRPPRPPRKRQNIENRLTFDFTHSRIECQSDLTEPSISLTNRG